MTVITDTAAPSRARGVTPLPLRLAVRDLRGGLTGFYVFIACIALGVAAIAAVRTVAGALEAGVARGGRILLGGDLDASVIHRRATNEERALIAPWGDMSETATLRGMARTTDGARQALVDIKAVDGAYPLYGQVELEGGGRLADAIAGAGAAIDAGLAAQLGLTLGETIALGQARVAVSAIISREPDRIAGGPAFGPRVLISNETLRKTELDEPGSLIRWHYKLRMADDRSVEAFRAALGMRLGETGFSIRDSSDPSPGLRRNVERLTSFLTLAGLAALLTGGVGVANAVSAFIERKRRSIAIYKALGASARLVNQTMLIEVLLIAALGVAIGLAIGVGAPIAALQAAAPLLPFRLDVGFDPSAALLAAAYGFLTALAFMLWPLGRANGVKAAELLRGGSAGRFLPPRAFLIGSGLSAAALVAAAVAFSSDPWIALWACVALAGLFVLFLGVGEALRRLAARAPRPRSHAVALALRSLGRPGGLTRQAAVSLGSGLTLLTAIALVGASLTADLNGQLPEKAPSHFFVGVPKNEYDRFAAVIAAQAPGAKLSQAPMLRGRMVSLAGVPVDQIKAPESAEWVLKGDRGLTFEAAPPKDSQIVEGAWWPKDYAGEPLVSFEVELARALGLKIGDAVTVNVLGRNITARLANMRTVKWESLDINFVMIFSPNTLAAAPYSILATLDWDERSPEAQAAVVNAVARDFPGVTAVRVADVLAALSGVVSRVLLAIQAAGGLTMAAGVLVLAGALAAAQERRVYDAVIFKTLGATRGRILAAYAAEQILLALGVGVVASLLGLAAAYAIVTQLFGTPLHISVWALLQAVAITTSLMLVFGLAVAFRVLRTRAAGRLRSG